MMATFEIFWFQTSARKLVILSEGLSFLSPYSKPISYKLNNRGIVFRLFPKVPRPAMRLSETPAQRVGRATSPKVKREVYVA
jgi:hypothetical protein